jgi:hypothetical protein
LLFQIFWENGLYHVSRNEKSLAIFLTGAAWV